MKAMKPFTEKRSVWQALQALVQRIEESIRCALGCPKKNPETKTFDTGFGKKLPQQIFAEEMRQRSNEPLWISPALARALAECERVHRHARRRKQKPCAVVDRLTRWTAAVILCAVLLSATYLIGAALTKAGKKAIDRHIDRILLEVGE